MKCPILWWTAVLAVLLPLASCGARASASPLGLAGNGDVVTRELRVSDFDSLGFGGSGILRIHRASSHRVLVTLDSNLQESFRAELRGSTLELGFKPGFQINRYSKLEIDVYLPELKGITLSGSAEAALLDSFRGDAFQAAISGSGRLIGEIRYSKVKINLSGSGTVELGGEADRLEAALSGSGRVLARQLKTREASAHVSGSGLLELRVRDFLEARNSGAGRIRYFGDPRVDSRVSGSGSVERAGA
jgi:hypothetical protein